MDKNDYIVDDEQLYRSVRGKSKDDEYYYDGTTGELIIRPKAFLDRKRRPSVDRAKLREFNPALSKLGETDGIVSLVTDEVRAIGEVITKTDMESVAHAVDVVYKPISTPPEKENLAHSEITVRPKFFGSNNKQDNAFKWLRRALSIIATKYGWTLQPPDD